MLCTKRGHTVKLCLGYHGTCLVGTKSISIHTGKGLLIKIGIVATVLDPGLVVNANNVSGLVSGKREARVGQEPANVSK